MLYNNLCSSILGKQNTHSWLSKSPQVCIWLLTSLIMMRLGSLSLWQFPTVEFPEKQGTTCSNSECSCALHLFIRPSSDGTYYGMVMSVRPSVRPGLRPSVRPSVRHSFPHFSPTCFEILSWNFVYHFIMMHVRASSNAINFRQFLMELCPFLTSNCYKYAVFRTFPLYALTFRAEILHMTLFYCTSEQVRASSISVNFCWSYAPFGT